MATITGTLESILDEEAISGSIVIALCGYGPQVPRVQGLSMFGEVTTKEINTESDGTFSADVPGNDIIVPEGTYYTVTVRNANGDVIQTNAYNFTDATNYDLDSTDPFDPSQSVTPIPPDASWPVAGIVVSTGHSWATSIDPATVAYVNKPNIFEYEQDVVYAAAGPGAALLKLYQPNQSSGTSYLAVGTSDSQRVLVGLNLQTPANPLGTIGMAGAPAFATFDMAGNWNLPGNLTLPGGITVTGDINSSGGASFGRNVTLSAGTSLTATIIDPYAGAFLYLNWDKGQGVNFGNGAGGVVAAVDATGSATFNDVRCDALSATGTVTASDAEFATCEVDGSPVRTFANTPNAGGGMVYPAPGVGVSTGSAWGTSINPATLAVLSANNVFTGSNNFTGLSQGGSQVRTFANTPDSGSGMVYPAPGVGVSTGSAWGTSIDPATLAYRNAPNTFSGVQTMPGGWRLGDSLAGGWNTGTASINAANNIVINAQKDFAVYFNYDQGSGVFFCNGTESDTVVASIDDAGNALFVSTVVVDNPAAAGTALLKLYQPNQSSGTSYLAVGTSDSQRVLVGLNLQTPANPLGTIGMAGAPAFATFDGAGNWNLPGNLTLPGGITVTGDINSSGGASFGSNVTLSAGTSLTATIIDPYAGAFLYLNWDKGQGVNFGNGAAGVVAAVDATGSATFKGTLTAAGQIASSTGLSVLGGGGGWGTTYTPGSLIAYSGGLIGTGADDTHYGTLTFWLATSNGSSEAQAINCNTTGTHITGTLSSDTKTFRIPHPQDRENRELIHACLEGPENGVFYRGEGRTSRSQAVITLPPYFEALTRPGDRSVLLAVIDEGDGLVPILTASRVKGGMFTVRSSAPNVSFYWEVKAIRGDVEPLAVERTKEATAA